MSRQEAVAFPGSGQAARDDVRSLVGPRRGSSVARPVSRPGAGSLATWGFAATLVLMAAGALATATDLRLVQDIAAGAALVTLAAAAISGLVSTRGAR